MSATCTARVASALTSLVVLFAAYASSVPAGFDTFDLSSVVGGVEDCTHVYAPLTLAGQCANVDGYTCTQMYRKCKTTQGLFKTICTEASGNNGCGPRPPCEAHQDATATTECMEVGT